MAGDLVPYDDIQERQERGSIGITAITRLKHADLFAAAKTFEQENRGKRRSGHYGGQSAMARKLKVCATELGKWINLRSCPPAEPRGRWTAKRLMRLEAALFKMTGKSMEELFPKELRDNIAFLASPKHFEKTVRVQQQALVYYAEATRERLLLSQQPDPFVMTADELKARIAALLDEFSPRERLILEHRYGLNNKEALTYEELVPICKVTRERIRQIEARVTRKLQERAHTPEFADLREVVDAAFD